MLGPVYLHCDGSYETYHAFFTHLRCKLDNINISGLEFSVWDLIVGSDEERALTKAVETSFPQAATLLCCWHLEENVLRRLQDKVGVPAEVRPDTVRRVFGTEGLADGRFWTLFSMTGRDMYEVVMKKWKKTMLSYMFSSSVGSVSGVHVVRDL